MDPKAKVKDIFEKVGKGQLESVTEEEIGMIGAAISKVIADFEKPLSARGYAWQLLFLMFCYLIFPIFWAWPAARVIWPIAILAVEQVMPQLAGKLNTEAPALTVGTLMGQLGEKLGYWMPTLFGRLMTQSASKSTNEKISDISSTLSQLGVSRVSVFYSTLFSVLPQIVGLLPQPATVLVDKIVFVAWTFIGVCIMPRRFFGDNWLLPAVCAVGLTTYLCVIFFF